MAEKDKIFYYLKLSESFMNGNTVDFLMSQKDGANYVVLYQMLIIKTINTGGKFGIQVGEVIIAFDVDKIVRDCKWFSKDTVIVALELYKKLGLVYKQENGIMTISNFEELVGSRTYWTIQKQIQKENNNKIGQEYHLNSEEDKVKLEKDKNYNVGKFPINVQFPLISISLSNILISYNFNSNINNIIYEWCQYKKEKNNSYKEIGFKQFLTKLKNDIEKNNYLDDFVFKCFKNCMANNYQGFFWNDGNTKSQSTEKNKLKTDNIVLSKKYTEDELEKMFGDIYK